jgi:aminomethyltransferase
MIWSFINEKNNIYVVNASNIDKRLGLDFGTNDLGVEMKKFRMTYSLLAIQGPKNWSNAGVIVYWFKRNTILPQSADFAGFEHVIISAGYTGSGGFEIYCKTIK